VRAEKTSRCRYTDPQPSSPLTSPEKALTTDTSEATPTHREGRILTIVRVVWKRRRRREGGGKKVGGAFCLLKRERTGSTPHSMRKRFELKKQSCFVGVLPPP